MLKDKNSLLFESAKIQNYQSSVSSNLVKKIRKTFQEAVWNHGFCLAINGISANETITVVEDLVETIETLIANQEKRIKNSYFEFGIPNFVQDFFNFLPKCEKSEKLCHQEIAENLQVLLSENFDYG